MLHLQQRAKKFVFVGLTSVAAILTACSLPKAPSSTEAAATTTTTNAYPKCIANQGTGYGAVYKCGDTFCAKEKSDYTVQCRIDATDPCVAEQVNNAERGLLVSTVKPLYDVGSEIFYNQCEANDGKGYGVLWDCGNAKCANATNDVPAKSFCRVTGGTLVEPDKVAGRLQSVDFQKGACQQSAAAAAAAAASKTTDNNYPAPGPATSPNDLADATFWDAKQEGGSSHIIALVKADTWYTINLPTQALSAKIENLKVGYQLIIELDDGTQDIIRSSVTIDDLSTKYPNRTVKRVRLDILQKI